MKKFLVGILIGVLLVSAMPGARAEDGYSAPVQVEVRYNKINASYNCYPTRPTDTDPHMIVYLIRPDGIASYVCQNGGLAWVMPNLPRGQNQLASY